MPPKAALKTALITARDFRVACATDDLDVVTRYIGKGGDVNEVDAARMTGLILAVTNGHKSIVEALIAVPGINLEQECSVGVRAIHRAAGGPRIGDDPAILHMLLRAGASTTARSTQGWTPLQFAMYWGARSIMLSLLERKEVADDVRSPGFADTFAPSPPLLAWPGMLTLTEVARTLDPLFVVPEFS